VEHTPHTSSKRGNSSHCTCRCGPENHGGLTPAALVNLRLRTAKIVFFRQAFATQYKSGRRKPTVANQHYCTGVSNSHGGLTPAALVNVRLCTAKIVFIPADARCTGAKSGGRKPPVEKCLSRRPESHICNSVRIRNQKRGGKPPVECSRHTSSIRGNSSHCTCGCGSENHGGLATAALDGVRLPLKLALPSASRSACHGGLTFAALVKARIRSESIADLYGDKRNTSGCNWRQPRHKSQSCTSGKVSLASVAPRVAMIVRFRQVATPALVFGPGVVGGAESQCSFASGKLQLWQARLFFGGGSRNVPSLPASCNCLQSGLNRDHHPLAGGIPDCTCVLALPGRGLCDRLVVPALRKCGNPLRCA